MKKILFLLTTALFLFSCSDDEEDPKVDFSIEKDVAYLTEKVLLTNLSNVGTSYFWDFGDGETSTSENPNHAFSADGILTVSLTIDGMSCEKNIEILPGSASYQVYNSSSYDFNLYTYYWNGDEIEDFEDRGILSQNETTDSLFTSRSVVRLGGYANGITFVFVEEFDLTDFSNTLIEITNESQVYAGSVSEKTLKSTSRSMTLNEYLK